MKLSEKAEEILEALWVAVEEEGQAFLDPDTMALSCWMTRLMRS